MFVRIILIFLIVVSASNTAFSQRETVRLEHTGITPSGIAAGDGKVMLEQDADLLAVVKRHRELNNNEFPGWRVQIFFGSGRTAMAQAKNVKEKFVLRYGHKYGSYIVYDNPYFKVRVGNFRTKAEALYFEHKIKRNFPNSWIVPDKVKCKTD